MMGKKYGNVNLRDVGIGMSAEDTLQYPGAEYDSADRFYDDLWRKTPKYSKGSFGRCAHSHPPLKFTGVDGKEYTVYGGACGDPVHENLDIYVALDSGTGHDPVAWPWNGTRQFVLFPITDMSVPKDAEEFKKMINWLAAQVVSGKSVHVGCLGGHGRTGMVLAALVKVMTGDADAISYVRKHYCKKAVETTAQSEWLHKHFDVKVETGYKSKSYSGWGDHLTSDHRRGGHYLDAGGGKTKALVADYGDTADEVKPFRTTGNIWGIKA